MSILDVFAPKKKKSKIEDKKVPYADITVILDESGSMTTMQQGVVDGINENIKKLREAPGDTKWTLVTFDDPASAAGAGTSFPNVLYENKSEKDVPYLTLVNSGSCSSGGPNPVTYRPRGWTALLDAVGMSIERAEARTSGQEGVTHSFMIITDGLENASKEYTSERIRALVAEKMSKGHQFSFLGANQDAWCISSEYGMATKTNYGGCVLSGAVYYNASNSFTYGATSAGIRQAIGSGCVGLFSMVSGCVGSGAVY